MMRRTSFARTALGALALAGLVAAGPALATPPDGFVAHGGTVPILTSYDETLDNYDHGYLTITPGSPGGPPDYPECRRRPVLDEG